jgi:8-oxo-dGTP diphosphatase
MPTIAAKAGQAKLRFLHVAVGVVEDGSGHVLIARRRPEKHQGGLWEFQAANWKQGSRPRAR